MATDINQIYQRIEFKFRDEELTEEKINSYLTRGGKDRLSSGKQELTEKIMQKYRREENIKAREREEEEEYQILIPVHSYRKEGHQIRAYSRHKPMRFTPEQKEYILTAKRQGVKPKQLTELYNKRFKETPRSYSSIKSETYRI